MTAWKALLLAAIAAAPSVSRAQDAPAQSETFGAEEVRSVDDPAAEACLSRSGIPFTSTKAIRTEDGWSDISSWSNDVFFYAGSMRCDAGRIDIRDAIIVKGHSEGRSERPDRAVKFDRAVMSGVRDPKCGPLSGMGIELENFRWFTWSGESSPVDRYYEVIRSSETGNEQRIRTSSHARISELVWSPVASTQCAISGNFAAVAPEMRWRGGEVSRVRAAGVSGRVLLHHPKVGLNIEGVRPSAGEVSMSGVELMNVTDRVTANADAADLSFSASAAGFAPFSLVLSKHFRPFFIGPDPDVGPVAKLFPADLSNATTLSDLRAKITIPSFRGEPSVVLPVSMSLDFGSVGIGRVSGSGEADVRLDGTGKARVGLRTTIENIGSADMTSEVMFRKFERHVLDDFAAGFSNGIDATPLLRSFSVSLEDGGIDASYLSLTGRTLRDVMGESSGPGISGAMFALFRDFRNVGRGSVNALFTSPVRIGEGFVRAIYASSGNFSGGA